jgi:hypothetical protein
MKLLLEGLSWCGLALLLLFLSGAVSALALQVLFYLRGRYRWVRWNTWQ